MAQRTLAQIYNENIAGKESNSTLNSLLPNPDNFPSLYTYENFRLLANTIIKDLGKSKVAVWRLIMFTNSYAQWIQEGLYDTFKDEVEDLTSEQGTGQLQWYVKKLGEFQLGDILEWIDDTYYGYSVIDETKQIITQAAATVSNGVVYLKMAKGEIGALSKLDTDELTAVEKYMKGTQLPYAEDGIAPAGVRVELISTDPDEIRFAIEVYYDPLVLDSDGSLLTDATTNPVDDAITNYIQQIPFDSKFRIIDFVDAIQAVTGVINVVVNNIDAKNSTQAWGAATDVTAATGQQYVTYSGYLKIGDDYVDYYDNPTNLVPAITYTAES